MACDEVLRKGNKKRKNMWKLKYLVTANTAITISNIVGKHSKKTQRKR